MKPDVLTDSGEMRFKGDTFICDKCGSEYAKIDDAGYEDELICDVCASARFKSYIESPCHICGKPMGKDDFNPFFSNSLEKFAHSECAKQLSDDELEEEEWYACWD